MLQLSAQRGSFHRDGLGGGVDKLVYNIGALGVLRSPVVHRFAFLLIPAWIHTYHLRYHPVLACHTVVQELWLGIPTDTFPVIITAVGLLLVSRLKNPNTP